MLKLFRKKKKNKSEWGKVIEKLEANNRKLEEIVSQIEADDIKDDKLEEMYRLYSEYQTQKKLYYDRLNNLNEKYKESLKGKSVLEKLDYTITQLDTNNKEFIELYNRYLIKNIIENGW